MSEPIHDREEAIMIIENVMLGHRLSWELSRLIVDALGIGQPDKIDSWHERIDQEGYA